MSEQIQKKIIPQSKQGIRETFSAFLLRNEFLIPLALFGVFLAVTLPGISWGSPSIWHPDEVVVRSIKALYGEWQFSEINFDYPDLPQYTMYWLGRVLLTLGYEEEILIAARVLSAVLAGLTVVLTYIIARKISNNISVSGLSALLLICASEMTHNARFAHNDTYITFFVTLTLLFLVNYKLSEQRGWLYASFVSVGMAASSKYNGISLVLAPVALYIFSQRQVMFKQPLRTLETLFIGGALTFLGYALGTPKALFWMTYYFKRMIPALLHTGDYARQPDSVRGILGQYASLMDGLGLPLFILFSAAFVWGCLHVIRAYRNRLDDSDSRVTFIAILLLAILALDLPIMVSYNYPTRFFLSLMPALTILAAFFTQDLYQWTSTAGRPQVQKLITVALSLVIVYSFMRNISVMLLFLNDPRIAASQFIETLPAGTSLEHTDYAPTIPEHRFAREHNYPVYFRNHIDEALPTSNRYVYNEGEAGLDKRSTEYLVIDSFTSDKFKNQYTCETMQVECNFFEQLQMGQSQHYKLMAEFSYALPSYLPQLDITFVNPTIRIYERIP